MTRGLIFWVLMLIWAVFALLPFAGFGNAVVSHVGTLLEFVLFLLLGWNVFGPPVHG